MQWQAAAANSLWLASCAPHARRFEQAVRSVQAVQERRLVGYLRANAETDYGRRHSFARIRSVASYRQSVPLSSYDDYTPFIDAMAAGRPNVLTAEPVRLFELSSGSTAAAKLIPYTATLQAEFQQALGAWIADLYRHEPALLGGPAYWSITPLTDGPQRTAGGIPIGFEDDSAYLGALGRLLAAAVLAAPNALKRAPDMASFRYLTLLALLRQPDLRLISVWNPTFLSLLLEPLSDWWPHLLRDLGQGTVTGAEAEIAAAAAATGVRFPPAAGRARRLAGCDPHDYAAIWPRLRLISCWSDGPSAAPAERLAARFPGVTMQGKGLLATEGFVSSPLWGRAASVLAVTAHFFEFLPETAPERPRLAHELDAGERYQVVLTTGGGFYRYQLFDVVEVAGHYRQAPLLRFVGKSNRISDYFGEKVAEGFVAELLERLFAAVNPPPRFLLLAAEENAAGMSYTLYLEPAHHPAPQVVVAWETSLEAELCANFHYAWCRRLGQLAPARVQLAAPDAAARYLAACQARGLRLGNIKATVLATSGGWAPWLAAEPGEERVP